MISTEKRSYRELLTQRMCLAIASSVILQSFLVCCIALFVNLSADFTHWFQKTWATIVSLQMCAYFVTLVTVTVLQGILCSKIYLQVPLYHKNRFVKMCASLTAQNLFLRALHIAIGGIMAWLHLLLIGGRYGSLSTDCSILYGTCLIEEHYFLLLSGLWSGLYFSIKTNDYKSKYLRFPIIAQSKFLRLRQRIYMMLPTLMVSSIWSTLYYVIGYYFLGSYYRTALLSVITIQMEAEPLDTVSSLLNLLLMSRLWFYQFVFILTISSTYLLFEIFLTEWVQFRFDFSGIYTIDESEITLINALSMDKIPIMQHLGYFDLVTLAQKDQARRRILFTLSQPGGHPYNWNCIVQKCTDFIKKFSSDVNDVSIKLQDQMVCYNINNIKTLTTAVPTLQKQEMHHMRKLVPDIPPSLVVEADSKEVSYTGWFIQRFIKQKREAFTVYLLSKPFINYIFGEQEDNKIRYVLLRAQPVIWAVEAISSLSAFSLKEDSYGIVQKDVPSIISVLLSVKQALDKLQKSTVLAKKIQVDDKLTREIFASLRSAIKRSLYRIVTNFEPYIDDLFLESMKLEQLQSFLNYKE